MYFYLPIEKSIGFFAYIYWAGRNTMKQLMGRELLANEFNSNTNEMNQQIEVRPGFLIKGSQISCQRCGCNSNKLRIEAPCYCQNKRFYCLNCLQMGKIRRCSLLYSLVELNQFDSLSSPIMTWQGILSKQQEKASKEITESVIKKETRLIWAVTGAGKTEMIFAGIEQALKNGERVCIASPRVDVCLELAPRVQSAFPNVPIALLHGTSQERDTYKQLIIATTHQLMRFKEAFDVLIIDEIDAFPFTADKTLAFAAEKAREKRSCLIYLSATPSKKMQKELQNKELIASILPARYHGHPLPEPKCIFLGEKMEGKKANKRLLNILHHFVNQKRRFLLFSPNIKKMQELEKIVQAEFFTKTIASVHSGDPERQEKVLAMRKGELDFLLCTTILERGVTFTDIDVLVLGAEDRTFTEAALVQISGRAGRHRDYPTGQVVFLYHSLTRDMKRAIKQIKKMNQLARQKGFILS